MSEKLGSILIYMIIFIQLAYAESHASYYVTTIVSDMQGSTSTISKALEDISITTRFLELPRASGLSSIISTLSSIASKNQTGKDGEVIHLSQIGTRMKNILKEVYWNRILTSNEITKCSHVFPLYLMQGHSTPTYIYCIQLW